MSSVQRTIADWFLITAEVSQRPSAELPLDELSDSILTSFDGSMLTSNVRDAAGNVAVRGFGWTSSGPSSAEANDAIAALFRVLDLELFDYHPLLRWYAGTGDPRPQSVGHVPRQFLEAWQTHEVHNILKGLGAEQQLSIPLLVNGIEHQAVVVCRSGRDFTDDDLRLARSLQPLFTSLQKQAEVLASHAIPSQLADVLTGRELAVLRCVSLGMTADSAGRALSVSPRTVEKHLENTYRKLGVRNRVSAVLVAAQLGLIEPEPARAKDMDRPHPY
jgi:DNA-binding CsgD family transcriptional regulator